MKGRFFWIVAVLIACICVLAGCDDALRDGLSAEELEDIRDSLQDDDTSSGTTDSAGNDVENNQDPNQNNSSSVDGENKTIFYYVESGEVYHNNRDCGYLKKSTSVLEGTQAQVLAAGKTRLCNACSENGKEESGPSDDVVGEQTPPVDEENGENKTLFYYVESGEIYHNDRNCSYLKKSTSILEGTHAQVLAAGKTRLCSTCAKGGKEDSDTAEDGEDGEKEQTPTIDDEDKENKTLYYYVESGEVYHNDRNCSYLKKSTNVLEGTQAQLSAAGKTRLCSGLCQGRKRGE